MICERVSDVKTVSYVAGAMPRLILASTSRYRRELLSRLGLPFEAKSPGVPEEARAGEAPAAMAARLALAKARSIVAPGAVVIGSDQVASLDGQLLRKPGATDVAVAQLLACQGRTVLFHTAVALIATDSGATAQHVDVTEVRFRRLDTAALAEYVRREQPLDCAGSFKSEGLGVALFEQISSYDPTALIGLPLIWLAGALRELGVDPLAARS
jgi:septum formation protein